MKSLMQRALGEDWNLLPPALQRHYRFGESTDSGHMDIEYPRFMQPCLSLLGLVGALVKRSGRQVPTVVEKSEVGERQYWRRSMSFADGTVLYFNSFWVAAGADQVIEFVNPLLGLQMAPYVQDGRLHYRGVCFVLKLGPLLLSIPQWLALGNTSIVEEAIDLRHFAMDFRLTHPLLGQVFRYSGRFEAGTDPAKPAQSAPDQG